MPVKIKFKGEPAMMDFSLVKLTGGANLIDNHDNAIYSLGSGELTSIVTEAGESLRHNLEATLENMKPNQSIRVQILIHANAGYQFIPPNYYQDPSFGEKARFMISPDAPAGNVISARPKGEKGRKEEEVKIIIVDDEVIVSDSRSNKIKHATPGDNIDEGADVITQT